MQVLAWAHVLKKKKVKAQEKVSYVQQIALQKFESQINIITSQSSNQVCNQVTLNWKKRRYSK